MRFFKYYFFYIDGVIEPSNVYKNNFIEAKYLFDQRLRKTPRIMGRISEYMRASLVKMCTFPRLIIINLRTLFLFIRWNPLQATFVFDCFLKTGSWLWKCIICLLMLVKIINCMVN